MSEEYSSHAVLVAGLAVVLAVALAAGGAAAQSDRPGWASNLAENTSEMVSTYNDQVSEEDLGTAAKQLAGERVNLVVEDDATDETATVSFRMTKDLEIREFSPGPREDATLRMTASRATVERIVDADRPGVAFRSAIKSRDVRISGVGLVNQVKWTVINEVGGALGFFD